VYRNQIYPVLIIIIVFVLGLSSASARPYLIWNPCDNTSSDIMHEILQTEEYDGIIVTEIEPYLDNLDAYRPLIIFAEGWCDNISLELLDDIGDDIVSYLENDGSIYWQGENTAFFHDLYRETIFNFDIATCIPEPFESIHGVSSPFESLTLSTITSTAEMIGGGDGTAFCNTCWCPDISVFNIYPYRTIINSFRFSCLTDDGPNTRADFVNVLMEWLNGMVDAPEIDNSQIPHEFAITENYPNPFNAQTVICYTLPQSEKVQLVVYNVLGQPADILFDGLHSAGMYQMTWNAEDCPSGVYFIRLESRYQSHSAKVVLIK